LRDDLRDLRDDLREALRDDLREALRDDLREALREGAARRDEREE